MRMKKYLVNTLLVAAVFDLLTVMLVLRTFFPAMNLPSLDKYENDVKAGGKIFVDSSLIGRKVERTDVDTYYVPATQLASDAGLTGLANMILAGKILKELGEFEDEEAVAASLKKVVSVKHPEMYEKNLTALKMGRDY